jgi:L-threonylcarbamoyladenylate synthase
MTATQAAGAMIQRYDLAGAVDILRREGVVLLPTDSLWCIACAADNPVALERLRRLKPPSAEHPYELLFADLDHLKRHAPRLHPRLETLLAFHDRPLTILTQADHQLHRPAVRPDGLMAARVVQDRYCRQLVRLLGTPLATAFAYYDGSPYPDHFGRVRSDIISKVDYVARYRPREVYAHKPTVLVQINQEEELEFLRE